MRWADFTGEAWGVATLLVVLRCYPHPCVAPLVWMYVSTITLQFVYRLDPLPWGAVDLVALAVFAYLWFADDDRVALAGVVATSARLFIHAAQYVIPAAFVWYASAVVVPFGLMLVMLWKRSQPPPY